MKKDFKLSRGLRTAIQGSAHGLLFMRDKTPPYIDNYVCNPITREYIRLPEPEGIYQESTVVKFGFGVSRLSNQYKVVRIFHDCEHGPKGSLLSIPKSLWQVYTLGTESWRNITTPCEMLLDYTLRSSGKLLNGNLYWLATDLNGSLWISCLDLETEVFTKFRAPMGGYLVEIGVLRDRLCLCDNSSETEISIYVMNDYGDEKIYWNKEYAISKNPDFSNDLFQYVYAVKAFQDGDILIIVSEEFSSIFYYDRTKTMADVDMLNGYTYDISDVVLYIQSFISLKDFETETAKVFEFVCSMS